MSNKGKYTIQPQRFQTALPKQEAISRVEEYINENISEYFNGEEIVVTYKRTWVESGETMSLPLSVPAIVIINDGQATVRPTMANDDTLKIVESEEEPEDKSALWLVEESGSTSIDIDTRIAELKDEISKLKEIIERHDYALSSTLAGGDIITNSEKYEEEISEKSEKPEDAVENVPYAKEDFEIDYWELYFGNSPFPTYYESTDLYKGQKYQLKPRFFNKEGEQIDPEVLSGISEITIISLNPEIATYDDDTFILLAEKSGSTSLNAFLILNDGTEIKTRTYPYDLTFEYNEEPYYVKYGEPNVHHMLVKSAKSYDVLTANTDYLCTSEFIWCVSNNTLYLKAEAANGTIQLFKINGQGSVGPTSNVTFRIEDKTLYMEGEELGVTSDGVISLPVGATIDNGIIMLEDI